MFAVCSALVPGLFSWCSVEIFEIRPLTAAQTGAARLGRPKGAVGRIRAQHHERARLLALGLSFAQVARALNMTAAGIRAWAENAANEELIASYRQDMEGTIANFLDLRTQTLNEVGLLAAEKLKQQLVDAIEAGEEIPIEKLVKLAAHADDRTGLGRQETRVNMNIDIGSRLDKAREAKSKADEARASGRVVPFARRI